MDGIKKQSKELENTEDIPIELLQTGIHISEKEVLEHSYLILEVLFNLPRKSKAIYLIKIS
jgi:hypothetical protein